MPSRDSIRIFDNTYHVKRTIYSSSAEGDVMRVKREDYTKEMDSFAKNLVEHQVAK